MPRVERGRRGAGQQGRVQQVVCLVDQGHTGALTGQQALERPCGVEAPEPAASDHNLPGHAYTIGCSP